MAAVRGARPFGPRLTKAAADAQLAAARKRQEKAFAHACAVNMARPGTAMDYPDSYESVQAAEEVRLAERAVRRAR